MEKMSVGLIGCGYWGKNYVKTIAQIPDMRLKYIYDIVQPSIAIPEGIIFTRNMDELLNDAEINAVIIAIPTRKIFEIAKKCLEAGKHILMEKPMTDSSEKAKELIRISKEKNLRLMVGHIFVYHPIVRKLKELIDSGELGKILHIYSIRAAPGPVRNADEINALWDLAPHDISIFLYLLGQEPDKVRAFSSDFLRPGIIDSASFSLRFGNVLAEAHVRWLDAEKIRKLTVIGDKKIAVFDDVADKKLVVYDKKVDFGGGKAKIIDSGAYEPEPGKTSALEEECRHFLNSVRENKKPLTDGENGLAVVRILEEIENAFSQEVKLSKIMQVKFNDLTRIHNPLKTEMINEIGKIIETNSYILGGKVEEFEKNFAKAHNVEYGVGVDSGTSALELALKALGIGAGDEVIVPANTFIATASAVVFAGAKPVFVDCDENYNLGAGKIERAITSRTKAIIPVHLYGQPADMAEILQIAKNHKLFIVEDACQAHGASCQGYKVGKFGNAAAFSFYPGKNLGGMGDGGIVLTDSKELAERIKMLRNYGQAQRYHHDFWGYNKRLDAVQAAFLNIKLKHLDDWNAKRRRIASMYGRLLKDVPEIILPNEKEDRQHVYHLYVLRTSRRDELGEFLKKQGIETGLHYPIPIHLQKSYSALGYKQGDFPNAEKYSKEILSLPIFPEMTDEEAEYVCDKIIEFFSSK